VETALIAFVIVTSVAVIIQMAILAGMYIQMRQANERVATLLNEFQARVNPILTHVDRLVSETQPRIVEIVADASEVAHIARSQAQKFDRVVTESLDRLRMQLLHADQILTGALETIEDTGSSFKRSVEGPVRQASAIIRGIKTGIEFFRNRRTNGEAAVAETSDEGLFI
jgi:hypothetical protein